MCLISICSCIFSRRTKVVCIRPLLFTRHEVVGKDYTLLLRALVRDHACVARDHGLSDLVESIAVSILKLVKALKLQLSDVFGRCADKLSILAASRRWLIIGGVATLEAFHRHGRGHLVLRWMEHGRTHAVRVSPGLLRWYLLPT